MRWKSLTIVVLVGRKTNLEETQQEELRCVWPVCPSSSLQTSRFHVSQSPPKLHSDRACLELYCEIHGARDNHVPSLTSSTTEWPTPPSVPP
jgi:hypothetical protein